jgi:chitinase
VVTKIVASLRVSGSALALACAATTACGADDASGVAGSVDGGIDDAASFDGSSGGDSGTSSDGSIASDGSTASDARARDASGGNGHWVMGYYAGYEKDLYPVAAIEWSGLTHLAVAFYLPRADGTLDETLFIDSANGPALARSLVSAAHANGRQAIASIGGAGMHAQWISATSPGTRAAFIANLKKLVADYGYDGLDLDWEPVAASDAAAVLSFVQALRVAMPAATLTMPTGYINVNAPDDLSLYPKLAPLLDQINLMTYGMAGAYFGWKSWHSSALHQTDSATPTSVESSVKAYLAAGVPAGKLGVGAGFYGLCYTPPVSAPLQALGASTIVADDGVMSFTHITATYLTPAAHHYDAIAAAPYLSFASATGPQGCGFVSYEDEQSLADKGAYVKAQALGGAIVWTINQGYVATAPPAARSPLLVALRKSVLE